MGHSIHPALRLAALVGVLTSGALAAGPAAAQGIAPVGQPKAAPAPAAKGAKPAAKPSPKAEEGAVAAQPKKDPAAAQRMVDSGVKSYEAGKLDPAIQAFSAALRGGGLPPQQMAKALYFRGLAYRKQGKPAQAISDLTSSLWLKGGLDETQRADAADNRAAAYREAGLDQPGAVAPAPTPTAAAQPAAAVADKAPARKPVPAAAAAAPAAGWQTATAAPAPAAPPAAQPAAPAAVAAAPAAPAPAPAPAPPASSGSGIGGFFSNMFGGGASKPSDAPVTTASTGPAKEPNPAVSSWAPSAKTPDARPTSVAAATPAAVQAAAAAAPPKAKPAGKYRLHIAAVRSRDEANALAVRLKKEQGAIVGARETFVDETVIGSMGTFYRVRVGPYAEANEPRQHCVTLRAAGFDCLLVTQ